MRIKPPNLTFCFDPPAAARPADGELRGLVTKLMRARRCRSAPNGMVPLAQLPRSATSITIVPRSTMGVLYRLGEIARAQLGLTERACVPAPGETQCATPMLLRYRTINGKQVRLEEPLFKMSRGQPGDPLSVFNEGQIYAIAMDANADDHSSEVLAMVEELQALNSSAKDLPAPNLINVH